MLSSAALARAIAAPPSVSDRRGSFYGFRIPNDSKCGQWAVKMGRAEKPGKRKRQWARQCRGQTQIWLPFCWEVPYAAKFGELS